MSKLVQLEGRNTVWEALASEGRVVKIVIGKQAKPDAKVEEIIRLAKNRQIDLELVDSRQLRKLTKSPSPQNVVAMLELPEVSVEDLLAEIEEPFLLAINRLDYEQNLGAILRTAWGAGVDAVLVASRGVHEVTPVVAKVSMGAVAFVPVISGSLFPMLKMISDQGVPVVGVEGGHGMVYWQQDLSGPITLVVGGEDAGLSEPLKKYCDALVHIPMNSNLSSLNVSTAVAVMTFEKRRQEALRELKGSVERG